MFVMIDLAELKREFTQKNDEKIRPNRRLTIDELHRDFPQTSRQINDLFN